MDTTTLIKFNYENPPDKPFPRTKETIDSYDDFTKTDGPKEFITNILDKLKINKFHMCPNIFPYDIQPPIIHSCLWYRGNTTKEEILNFLHKNNIEYVTFFENPNHLKSVKDISHYHIFHY